MYESDIKVTTAIELMQKYPGRIPLIALRHHSCSSDIKLNKSRYLVPMDIEFGCIQEFIRRRIYLAPGQSLYIFCENTLVPLNDTVSQVYRKYVSKDGFLYAYYATENVFG